ncbi:hypothetical protein [Sinorhizobium fredii]|uniref:hypothetical protein n=1 Tax=Rhizobium fredii TaxID=380 RepID=UPI0029583A4F|nr:hypothetical protein [Sinorhizobium fredii]WOS64400.1 hypothetical protein SFGR64A_08570 [Sinorhizobium fredii GR64]
MSMFKTVLLASLPLLFDPAIGKAKGVPATATEGRETAAERQKRHLSEESTIGDVMRHPAFTGFGGLILPWDDRAYDERMKLSEVGDLLPYHSHVDTKTVLGGLNRMIDDIADGKQVFYEIYTDAEKHEEPSKAKTGLFFFRGKAGAPFAIVAPGGGFAYVGSVHDVFRRANLTPLVGVIGVQF